MGTRKPAVAGRFYPGTGPALESEVITMLDAYRDRPKKEALAVVCPHAGYFYSGAVCAETLQSVTVPETVLMLGPNHHGHGAPISISLNFWEIPGRKVPVNQVLAGHIESAVKEAEFDEFAHLYEHSLEVQIPFLAALQKNLSIVPISLSSLPFAQCMKLAEGIASSIRQYPDPVLILASTDMSHYESREEGSEKDRMALHNIESLNPTGLYQTVLNNRISMCGFVPVTIALQAAMLLGADNARIIRYTDSGEASGDTAQVVGYAGAVIRKNN